MPSGVVCARLSGSRGAQRPQLDSQEELLRKQEGFEERDGFRGAQRVILKPSRLSPGGYLKLGCIEFTFFVCSWEARKRPPYQNSSGGWLRSASQE